MGSEPNFRFSWLSRHMTLRKLGLLGGVLAPLLWLSLIGVAGALRPEFSHVTHYISELGERDSTTEFLVRYGAFVFTGFLYLCFAAALMATFRGSWAFTFAAWLIGLDGMGRMGAGVFPCDPGCSGLSASQELHHLFATIGFLSGVLAALTWGVALRLRGASRAMSGYSFATGLLALLFLLLMQWRGNPVQAAGLFEHLASGLLSVWVLVLAVRTMRGSNPALRHD
ncbi:MAG TPA: DUF998 domain-containing protein [Rhodocyclaceae bacterium]|nr:DUF998 domain-containing protein [Rhodocyclaceae bacterium]